MIRVYGLLSLLSFGFFLYCLLDVALSESTLVRNLPKLTWVFIVVFVPLIGGIVWLVAGRPERAALAPGSTRSRGQGGRNASTRGHPVRRREPPPRGPDDDPDFLRRLDDRLREEREGDDT